MRRKKPWVHVIYLGCRSPCTSIVLPSSSGEPPSNAGLHELSAPEVHSTCIAACLVGSYPTFSPLPMGIGGCFLLHCYALADIFPLGSRLPYAARTFLLYILKKIYRRHAVRLNYVYLLVLMCLSPSDGTQYFLVSIYLLPWGLRRDSQLL